MSSKPPKLCRVCQSPILGHKRTIFCTYKCKVLYYTHINTPEEQAKRRAARLICAQCKKTRTPPLRDSIYCSPACAREARRATWRAHKRRQYNSLIPPDAPKLTTEQRKALWAEYHRIGRYKPPPVRSRGKPDTVSN